MCRELGKSNLTCSSITVFFLQTMGASALPILGDFQGFKKKKTGISQNLGGSQIMGELEGQKQLNFCASLTVNHIMHFAPVLLWERCLDPQL